MNPNEIEVTVLMPCLNEAETLAVCIRKAIKCLADNNVTGEVLIADNGSTDGSQKIAEKEGARIVDVEQKGYGSALIGGTLAAKGKYCIMGDADDSYDFSNLMPYIEKLREGADLVMGNRFKGGIEKGAMPFLHKYLGTPVISFIGRWFYHNKIGDFNCGMRGYNTESIKKLNLSTSGMEYASEMIVKASLYGLRIEEVPTTLSKDGRSRAPYLSTWSDGWRHLKFLLLHSPDWLFLFPGLILFAIGLIGEIVLSVLGNIVLGNVVLGVHTLLYCMTFVLVGITTLYFYSFAKIYAEESGFIPSDSKSSTIVAYNMDKGVFVGFIMLALGIIASVASIIYWKNQDFGSLNPEFLMRLTVPAATLITVGIETMFASFLVGVLKIKRKL